jgi:hypothetical protein
MNLSYHSAHGRATGTSVSLELPLVGNCPNDIGDAYGGLRLRIPNVSHLIKDMSRCIVIMSNRIKDIGHHTANVSSRLANVIPTYAIDVVMLQVLFSS